MPFLGKIIAWKILFEKFQGSVGRAARYFLPTFLLHCLYNNPSSSILRFNYVISLQDKTSSPLSWLLLLNIFPSSTGDREGAAGFSQQQEEKKIIWDEIKFCYYYFTTALLSLIQWVVLKCSVSARTANW